MASRACGIATDGEVVITEQTYRALRGSYACDALGPTALKGKREPVEAYVLEQLD